MIEKSDHSRSSYLSSQYSLLSRCFDETDDSDNESTEDLTLRRGAAFYLSQVLGEMSIDRKAGSDTLENASYTLDSITSMPSLSSILDDDTLRREQESRLSEASFTSIDLDSTSRLPKSPYKRRSYVVIMDPCAGNDKLVHPVEKRNSCEKKDLRWFAESSNGANCPTLQTARDAFVTKPLSPTKDASPMLLKRARTPSFDTS